jgi:MFS family permease
MAVFRRAARTVFRFEPQRAARHRLKCGHPARRGGKAVVAAAMAWHKTGAMPTSLPERWRSVATLATTPPFRDFLAGRVLAATGVWVFRITTGWMVWSLTRSPAMLGVATFLLLAPQMILSPFSGVIADRRDRRAVLVWSHAASAAVKLMVGAFALAGMLTIELLLPLLVLVGSVGALSQASNKTIVAALVVEDDLATAVSLNSVVFNLAGFIGPAIGGAVIALAGPAWGFLLSSALAAAFVLSLRNIPALPPEDRSSRRSMFIDLGEALKTAASDPLLRPLLALHMASATLARPFLEFVPAIVGQGFRGGAPEVAMMTSVVGIGSVVGGLWLAQRDNSVGMLPVVLGAMVSLGVALIALAWVPYFWMALVLAFVAGFGMITRAAAIQSMVQMEAPAGMRGRIISFYGLILNGGSIVGALAIGLVAELTGISVALTLSVLAALVVWARLRPVLTKAVAERQALRAGGA